MPDKPAVKTAYYRIERVDNYTARLIKIYIEGRRISREYIIMESSPTIIYANWQALTAREQWNRA